MRRPLTRSESIEVTITIVSPNAKSFMTAVTSTSGRLHSEFVRLLFLQAHRETDRFFASSGVQLEKSDRGYFYFRPVSFLAQFKSRVGLTLAKSATLRIVLNLDGAPITSNTVYVRVCLFYCHSKSVWSNLIGHAT